MQTSMTGPPERQKDSSKAASSRSKKSAMPTQRTPADRTLPGKAQNIIPAPKQRGHLLPREDYALVNAQESNEREAQQSKKEFSMQESF